MTTELTRRGSSAPEPDEGKRTRGKKADRKAKPVATRTGSVARQEPRVDLLPPEVKVSRRNEAIARRLVLALVIVILVVAGGIGGSTYLAIQANSALTDAQNTTTSLAQQQLKYAGVRTVQSQIALTKAGQEVGASTEIDWSDFLTKAREATSGAGLTMTGVILDSSSPLAAYQQSTVPLQGQRVATVTLDAKGASLDQVSAWLSGLAKLPAVADVSPGTVTLAQSGYTASATIHLNESAYDGRFASKGK